MPFDFYHDAIIIQVTVNGKGPLNMLLDTGVDPSVVDLATAKVLGLQLAAKGDPGTGGGTGAKLAYETELRLVELGGLRATGVAALAVDLSKTSATLGKPVQGVLGYSLLKDRIAQFDFLKHVVRFYADSFCFKEARRVDPSKLTTLAFRYRDKILVDGVLVNGTKMTANLDTGSNSSFQLTPAAVTEAGLETAASGGQTGQSVGINGVAENRRGKIKNITLGAISVDEPTVVFYGKGTGHDHESWGLRIGNAFLKDFVVTIDYQNSVLGLEKP